MSFGSLQAGLDHNSIPEKAVIKGSIRVQDVDIRNFIGDRLKCICENIAKAYRAECEVDLKRGSSTVMNDEKMSELVAEATANALGKDSVVTRISSALMGSDDFANYAERVPSVYYFLCTNNPEKGIVEANHNPRFDIDEDVLWKGVASYVATALKFLEA